jgi:hypothetical protein
MNRKVSALVAMIFALGLPVEAQQPAKVHRVGRLSAGSPADPLTKESFETFRQGLHDLGLDRRPKHRSRASLGRRETREVARLSGRTRSTPG